MTDTFLPWTSEAFAAVDRCVYAKPGEEHTGPFTDEHIIPFGLLPKGGDWFLPRSSCNACADVTKKFENAVLRDIFGPFRAQLNLKTRRKKGRETPRKFVFKRPDGESEIRELHYSNIPKYCVGYRWDIPGILRAAPIETYDFEGEMLVRYPKEELETFIPDQHGVRLARIRTLDFARALAKIAHVYAYAKCGPNSFEPALLDLILGRSENAPYFVGGDHSGEPTPQPNVLHDIYPVNCRVEPAGIDYLAIAIRLFAFWNMPRYIVVVGRRLKF